MGEVARRFRGIAPSVLLRFAARREHSDSYHIAKLRHAGHEPGSCHSSFISHLRRIDAVVRLVRSDPLGPDGHMRPDMEDHPWGRGSQVWDPFGNRIRFNEPKKG
jgi:hypothetical protein